MDVMTLTRSKLSALLNQTMKHFSSEKTVLLTSKTAIVPRIALCRT